MTNKISNPKKWTINFVTGAFAIALALLFTLVLQSISVQITPPPDYRDEPYPDVATEAQCDEAGGRWVTTDQAKDRPVAAPLEENAREFCQGPLTFERQQTIQREDSQQTSLFVYAIGGGLAVALSLLVIQLKPVAPGLMLGGIASFFIAGIRVWTLSPGFGRMLTIVVLFLALVAVGIYTLREHE